jgi:hypothetical protein
VFKIDSHLELHDVWMTAVLEDCNFPAKGAAVLLVLQDFDSHWLNFTSSCLEDLHASPTGL